MNNPDLRAALTALIASSSSMEDLAVKVLLAAGVTGPALYQAAPAWHSRTVGRANKAVRMVMDSCSETLQTQTHADRYVPDPEAVAAITEASRLAAVRLTVAMSSVRVYGNPVTRVLAVLGDIAEVRQHQRIWNPSGLFVRKMRDGSSVELPPAVVDARQHREREQAQAKAPGWAVGMTALASGVRVTIQRISRCVATVVDPDGFDFEFRLEQLRPCPG